MEGGETGASFTIQFAVLYR